MSVRLRIFTHILTAILVFSAIGIAVGFLLFITVANPFFDGRLSMNIGQIAARYFAIGGLVLLLLTGIGVFWVSSVIIRYVVRPLSKLKRAANEIGDGNLDYELVVSGNDEFTELGACFEQMRIRLKDSTRISENAETERRALMASVTHDLQTPITSILGYAEGILDGVADTPEKTLEYAAVIRRKAKSLESLADDLSLLSKLENAQLPLDRQDVDFGEMVEGLAEEFFSTEPDTVLDMQLERGLKVTVDTEKIARVLTNIFQNAIKYKKPEQSAPELTITLRKRDDSALLTITDNGIEVTQNDLPHLFDRFYRADSSRGKQQGSGLGLSIARQLVHLHEGKIWIAINPTGGLAVNILLGLRDSKS